MLFFNYAYYIFQILDESFTMLTSLLKGKTWTGKEKILAAMTSLLKVAGPALSSQWSSYETFCEVSRAKNLKLLWSGGFFFLNSIKLCSLIAEV